MNTREGRTPEKIALDESEKAYRELAVLAYSAAHDLRAPLRSIGRFSELLLKEHDSQLSDQGKQYMRRIQASGQTMLTLLEALMKLVSLARADVRRIDVDLSAAAETVAAELRRAEPDRKVDFAIQPGLRAVGDPDFLAEVLENLLGNAWKFSSRRPRARIEFGAADRGGETAYFVRDDGAGFDPLYAGKLFMPFQRLHGAAEFPGIGAGLAIVRSIVRLHGGEVSAEGEVEKGATVTFTLGRLPAAA